MNHQELQILDSGFLLEGSKSERPMLRSIFMKAELIITHCTIFVLRVNYSLFVVSKPSENPSLPVKLNGIFLSTRQLPFVFGKAMLKPHTVPV